MIQSFDVKYVDSDQENDDKVSASVIVKLWLHGADSKDAQEMVAELMQTLHAFDDEAGQSYKIITE